MLQLRLGKIFGKRMGIQSDQPEIRLCGLFVLVYVNIQNFIADPVPALLRPRFFSPLCWYSRTVKKCREAKEEEAEI